MTLRSPLLAAFQGLEVLLDRIFGHRWNPLYQLGALGFFYYWVVAVTGIYIYIFFDTGTTEAYDSVEYLTNEQWYLGGVMRSLHRYGSDGMVLMMVVHMLREWAYGRFKGPRWFTWITGLPVAAFVVTAGISGYWLVWDKLAQYVAIETSEWFDWLGIFGEPIARNFLSPSSLDDRLFTLLVFIHIVVPLLLLLVLWIHLIRITKPQINPNRGLAVGTFVMLIALSLVEPAVSHAPADLGAAAGELRIDWYYLAIYPLIDEIGAGAAWGLVVCVTIILGLLPWLPPRVRLQPAVVHLESCNGCERCAEDCPYEAILMKPRSDGLPFKVEAVVDAELCMACGICAGSCPTATPFRRRSALVPGIELPDRSVADLKERLLAAARGIEGAPRLLLFTCGHSVPAGSLSLEGVGVVAQPCIAGVPPSFVDYVLSQDLAEGVMVTGCRNGVCEYRFGPEWSEQRFAGARDPHLRKRVPRERLKVAWFAAGETKALLAEIAGFREALAALPPPEKPTRAKQATTAPPVVEGEGAESHV